MKKLALSAIAVFCLSGCTGVTHSTRLTTDIEASEYNSIIAKYKHRPTFVEYETHSNSDEAIRIKMDMYGSGIATTIHTRSTAQEMIFIIDKYINWEEMATKEGDQISKNIGTVDSFNGSKMEFNFHSGNSRSHCLKVSFCPLGDCSNSSDQFFDKENSIKLKELVISLRDRKFELLDVEEKYK